MKYWWLSIFLFCHAALAYCPDEDELVTLQGTLIQETRPGQPNYESIKDGDEPLTYDFLTLNIPLECDVTGEREDVPLVQLILMGEKKPGYAELAPFLNKDVLVTGQTMYAYAGRHYTSVLVVVDGIKGINPIATPEQKKSALLQLQQFQQVLREKDVAALKAYFVFPVEGDTWGFLPDFSSQQPEILTEAVFDQNAPKIMDRLQMLSNIAVNPDAQTISEYRINALSKEQQQRRYFPAADDGIFYYEENGQKHTVEGVCDDIADGEFQEGSLHLFAGTSANKQLPGLSESCDGASSYKFLLVDGKLKLTASFTAG